MDSLTAGFSKLGELVGLSSPKRPVPGEHTQQVRGAMFPPLTGDEGGAAPRRAAPAGSGCCTSPPGRPPSTRLSEASVEGGGTSARLSAALGAASSNEALAPAPAPREASARPPAAAASASGASTSAASSSSNGVEDSRSRKFGLLLAADVVDMKALRSASWSGVPAGRRAMVWQLMLGYLPANREGRTATLERKRREYLDAASMYFDVSDAERCAALSPPLARYACTPARPTTAPRPAPNPRPPAAHPPPRTACRTENQKKNLHQIVIVDAHHAVPGENLAARCSAPPFFHPLDHNPGLSVRLDECQPETKFHIRAGALVRHPAFLRSDATLSTDSHHPLRRRALLPIPALQQHLLDLGLALAL